MATSRLCYIENCGKPSHSSGMCSMHYSRQKRDGDPNRLKPKKNSYWCEETSKWVPNRCSADNCEKPVRARDFCSTHLARFKRHGNPELGKFVPGAEKCSIDGCAGKKITRWKGKTPLCNKHYLRMWNTGSTNAPSERSERPEVCSVEGCQVQHHGLGYCEKHYSRLYRHRKAGRNLSVEKAPCRERYYDSNGYVFVYAPAHPLTTGKKGNYEREHRIVFYNNHGAGPFNCHHCDAIVTWDDMHVDHLNAVVDDNHPGNLVASCPTCNHWRGRRKMKETFRNKFPVMFNGVTRTYGEWAKSLGISRSSLVTRIKNGWTLEEALTTPKGKTGPKSKRHSDDPKQRPLQFR